MCASGAVPNSSRCSLEAAGGCAAITSSNWSGYQVMPNTCLCTRDFCRKFARAFEDIARDIEDGQEPGPHNMAE
jgi:hypothetical protein